MTVLDCIRAALQSLRINLMRTALTSLGIIIGVASVIAMVAVGAGAESRVQSLIQNLGSNMVIVLNGSRRVRGVAIGGGTKVSLTEQDAAAIEREIDSVLAAAPSVLGTGQVIYGNTNWFTNMYGVTLNYFDVRNWSVGRGRNFTAAEIRSAAKVTLLGKTVAATLFPGQDPIGQIIRIKRVPFEVIGILGEKGQTPWGRDQDDVLFLPLSTAKKRVLGGRRIKGNLVGSISVKAHTAAEVDTAVKAVTALLRQRHRLRDGQPDDFRIRNIAQFLEARAESSRVMTILLASIAGVSLIVGGIGIMNIMLVSVTERTREIGLRMAVGGRRRDIMSQFVIEAVSLSVLGGVIGILIGIGGSLAISTFAGWPMLIEPDAVALAVLFAGAVGVFFGFYPARKASRLDPIEALRHE